MSTLTWLHLSDLHAQSTDKFDRDKVVLKALWEDVERWKNEGIERRIGDIIIKDKCQPDFIIFTGDIAYHGKADEYKLAMECFFERLLVSTGLPREKLFIVPGNHDVDWDVVKLLSSDFITKLNKREDVNNFLSLERNRKILFEPLIDYATFIEDNFIKYWKDPCDPIYSCVRFHEHKADDGSTIKVALLGLNSAWLSGFGTNDYGNLLVGEHQVHEAIEQAKTADIRIAILHHPFAYFKEFDRDDVEMLLQRACHFVLHGHRHRSEFIREATLTGETVIIPAGAIYDRRTFPNGYNLIKLNIETGKGTLYLRRYSDRQHAWVKDIEATGEERDGTLEFEWQKEPIPKPSLVDKTLQVLHNLDMISRDLSEAYTQIAREAEWARRQTRVNVTSYDVIAATWRDCKRDFYSKLQFHIPLARKVVPTTSRPFTLLENDAADLDKAIMEESQKDILRAVEVFDRDLHLFRDVLAVEFSRHIKI